MSHRNLLAIFAATLFTSAFLIFSVQPMISKMLLPMLGGSPSVWNTAMVFFQAMLLAGYAYAHFVARYLSLKSQAIAHLTLLCLFTMVLPLSFPTNVTPPEEGGQALWQLGIMLSCVGGPFFVLAASAPLFQYWFSCSTHEDAEDPYFLYAVSNIGSMAALLGYPVIFEPLLTLTNQTYIWFCGYGLLIGLTTMCAWSIRNGVKQAPPLGTMDDRVGIGWTKRLIWIALAFIPSSLMLGVTTIITTDLASAPFLWVVPLALYLATFIIAFSRKPVISLAVARELGVFAIILVILMVMISAFVTMKVPIIIVHLLTFFLCAQICHGELAEAKPSPSHLTEYFLLISFGGVLGGIFNALIAPRIFMVPLEYSLTLATVPFVIWAGQKKLPAISGRFNDLKEKGRKTKLIIIDALTALLGIALCLGTFFIESDFVQILGVICVFAFLFIVMNNRPVFAVTCLAALLIFQPVLWSMDHKLLALDRNYFGVLKVYSHNDTNFFYHGTTLHGAQPQKEEWKFKPVTYYSPGGPASDIFSIMDKRGGNQAVAALGLGVGSIACYGGKGRHFDFYEIDSDVVKIAENPEYFSYLSGCGSPYKIVLGDARMKIADAPDSSYNMIFVDTFSSDNIPVHIMTREAFEIYLKKLAPDGIIAMNISNRFLDLRPVLAAISRDLGMTIYFKYHKPETHKGDVSDLYTESLFAVMAKDPKTVATFAEDHNWKPYDKPITVKVWTDDYANILSSLWALQD